jgi:cysteine-rich repeat protein
MSSNRFLLLVFLGAVLGACAQEPASIVCPTTGITCPAGTICAAAQPVCLVSSCGNGVTDAGEQCDDGNIHEGDGCSPNCKREECGNNIQDPGEVCDDGNTASGDGCAGDCGSEEECGNGVVDVGEDCDDMNNDNTDACVMCQNAMCGDGYKRAGFEECDGDNQGNPDVAGDNCSSSCQLEGCHNGRLDPGEECDDMNLDNADACVLECKNARCGDGVIRLGVEECDGDVDITGDGVPEDTCSDSCHLNGCGNGIKDPGEQCDDGCLAGVANECEPEDNGDGCSATCTFENCGNGVVDAGEQCDGDGMGVGGMTADCNIDCTASVCGDGKRNALDDEECDNGPTSSPTGNGDMKNCTASCKLNFCGDGNRDMEAPGLEACDEGPGGNLDDGMGCSSSCTIEGCGNGVINPGEQCEDGNMVETDSCINCQAARCGDGYVHAGFEQCDGMAGTKPPGHNEATCGAAGGPAACRWQYCGNGFLEGSEQCDDGNNTSGDGCTASCVREFCGDGVDNNGTAEACDPGPVSSATCDANCTAPSCGDGFVNTSFTPAGGTAPEQCDDGGNVNGDGCSSLCRFERCGNGILDTGEQCDGAAGTAPVPGAMCGMTGVTACRWIYCGNGILDSGEQCDNGAANSNTAACTATCKVNVCGDGFQLAGIEGCDDGMNNGATKNCTPKCQPNLCGDGYAHATLEQCDDGNPFNNDSCTTTCRTPVCGDAQINGPNETCDDGNTANGDGCRGNGGSMNACTVENNWTCTGTTFSVCTRIAGCGNGFKEGSEVCDDGDTMTETAADCTGYNTTCTFCNANCSAELTFVGPRCGDGMCNGPETKLTCPTDCPATCGDNIRQLGEACDNGMTSGDGCSSTCVVETGFTCTGAVGSASTCTAMCGDGIKASTEACDDGDLAGSDGCSSTCTIESGWTCSLQGNTSVCVHTPTCGDTVVEGTELCDYGTANNNGQVCANGSAPMYGIGNACVACNACMTTIAVDYCGDGDVTTPNEACDGSNLNAKTCVTQGFSAGTLACSATCGFDTSGCTYALTVMKTGTGSVAADTGGINCGSTCTGQYTAGTMVTLTATTSGTLAWSGGGCTGSATTCVVTMDAVKNVTVTFTP